MNIHLQVSSAGQCDSAIESPGPSPPGTPPPEPVVSQKSGGESFEGEEPVSHEEVSDLVYMLDVKNM